MKGREKWRQRKAKRSRGEGAKKDEWEEEEDGIWSLCCRLQGAGVAKGTVLPSIVGSTAPRIHGSPRQQVEQESSFLASPVLSCRVQSPAQPAAPACSSVLFTGGTGRTLLCPGWLATRKDGSNCLGLELPCRGYQHTVRKDKGRRKREQEGQREPPLAVRTLCARRKARMKTWHLCKPPS